MAELGAPLAQLDAAWRALGARWQETQAVWTDSVQGAFARDYWTLLADQVPATQREMQRLAAVIAQARRSVKS